MNEWIIIIVPALVELCAPVPINQWVKVCSEGKTTETKFIHLKNYIFGLFDVFGAFHCI